MGNKVSTPGNKVSTPTEIHFTIVTDKEEAQRLLQQAESVDLYLEECYRSKSNAKARLQLQYQPNRIAYRDLKFFEVILENARSQIPFRLKKDLREVKILQLMPSADGGMPHTRPGGIVCYPDVSRFFSTSTLIHELWHVHQRMYEELWNDVFFELGWKKWDGFLPSRLEDHRRFNPDTLQTPLWVFQDQWVPVPIFKDISQPRVDEVELWFYDVRSQYHRKTVPESLLHLFPNAPPSAYEHPRELCAYVLSEPDRYTGAPGFNILLKGVGQLSILSM